VDHRSIARMTAAARVGVGVALLVTPGVVGRLLVGAGGTGPVAKVFARGMGVRDLVLGLGVLAALDRGDPHARDWIRAAALSDLGDTAANLLAFRHLTPTARVGALIIAGGAAATGFVAAENLD
jgi:hypothetical protein